ncbi:MAG: competence protein ComJ [Alphaproteobacteria bacterium]
MSETTLKVDVTYSQLAVFLSSLQNPFNDWTSKHVDQGFAWRQGSVSFRTLIESGQHYIELVLTHGSVPILYEAIRVIEVPFDICDDGAIEIASIADTVRLSLPCGKYSLRCELLPLRSDGCGQVRLVFSGCQVAEFKIVRADKELVLEGELLKHAEAAMI